MEELKSLTTLTDIDERHLLLGQLTGGVLCKEKLHACVGEIVVNETVPEPIRSQFNVARNMALYTYYLYSLAPEVHMKAFSVMEMALRAFHGYDEKTHLKALLKRTFEEGHLSDKGFRHVEHNGDDRYTKTFIEVFPKLRNSLAHGSTMLVPDCIGHLEKCADFLNQLFPEDSNSGLD